ncbi:MAG: ABC transporter permease subunit [Candidatus Aminicenantes bacterium]|nr:ABC transporter permease subunit [Candidatus Aminicenantes bacterium]
MKFLSIESKKIFNKKSLPVVLFFLIFSVYFTHTGISEYKSFLKEQENFFDFEKLNTDQWISYEQYGAFGFRLRLHASPLNIFFSGDSFLKAIDANIDTSEVIKVSKSTRGKARFVKDGYFKGFSSFFNFFASLLMSYVGLTLFRSKRDIRFYKKTGYAAVTAAKKLLLMLFASWVLFAVVLLFAAGSGIDFSMQDLTVFCWFIVFTSLVLSFFYMSGLLISLLFIENRRLKMTGAFLYWIAITALIPSITNKHISNKAETIQSPEKVNFAKLKRVIDFEREVRDYFSKIKTKDRESILKIAREFMSTYRKKIYPLNTEVEEQLIKEEKKLTSYAEKLSLILPTTYFNFLQDEISGNGYRSQDDFVEYIMKIRAEFVDFYIRKRYYSKDKQVQSFIKAKENIFTAEARLPESFSTAVGLHFLYLIVLTAVSFFLLYRCRKTPGQGKKIKETLFRGASYYKLFESEEKRNAVFNDYSANANTVGLDKIDKDSVPDVDGLKLKDVIRWFSYIREVDEKEVYRRLSHLEVPPDTILDTKEDMGTIKKIYAALILSTKADIIIINDFLKNEPRKFEKHFKNLIWEMERQKKTLIYLSSEIPAAEKRKALYEVKEESGFVKVDIDLLSFR